MRTSLLAIVLAAAMAGAAPPAQRSHDPGPPDSYSVWMEVHYAEDSRLKLMVPKDARERHWFEGKPEDRLEVESIYASFRRFQVLTDEQIKR